jgi:hypothetical protein
MLEGNEPRELIREYYRLRRRARDLTGSADAARGSSPFDAGHAPEAFLNWYATRHDEVPGAVPEAAAIIHEEWGPPRVSRRVLVLRLLAAPYPDGSTPDPRVLRR